MADNFNYNMQIVASQPLDAERLSILRSTIEGALMEYMPGVSVGEVIEEASQSFSVNVIVIKDGVVDESYLFVGDHTVSELAYKKFLELCGRWISNWRNYSPDDIEALLEDGYVEHDRGSICITWPEVTKVEEDDSFTEDQIEWMREQLITGGAGGALGSPNQPSYMSAEEVTERYQAMFPGQKVPR